MISLYLLAALVVVLAVIAYFVAKNRSAAAGSVNTWSVMGTAAQLAPSCPTGTGAVMTGTLDAYTAGQSGFPCKSVTVSSLNAAGLASLIATTDTSACGASVEYHGSGTYRCLPSKSGFTSSNKLVGAGASLVTIAAHANIASGQLMLGGTIVAYPSATSPAPCGSLTITSSEMLHADKATLQHLQSTLTCSTHGRPGWFVANVTLSAGSIKEGLYCAGGDTSRENFTAKSYCQGDSDQYLTQAGSPTMDVDRWAGPDSGYSAGYSSQRPEDLAASVEAEAQEMPARQAEWKEMVPLWQRSTEYVPGIDPAESDTSQKQRLAADYELQAIQAADGM